MLSGGKPVSHAGNVVSHNAFGFSGASKLQTMSFDTIAMHIRQALWICQVRCKQIAHYLLRVLHLFNDLRVSVQVVL